MDAKTLPLWRILETPLLSLDNSHVELFSLLLLFLLTLLAVVARHKRRQWIRHLVQLISIGVFFFVVYSCLGVFGMIRNLMHGTTLIGTVFTESYFWMSLPLLVLSVTITTGPYFCGWICPTGTLQEWATALRERAQTMLPRAWRRPALGAPLLILVGTCFVLFMGTMLWLGSTRRFYVEDSSLYWGATVLLLVFLVLTSRIDDAAIRVLRGVSFLVIFVSAILKTAIVSPVHFAFANVEDPASALTTLVLMVASLFVARAWCRYICPWGFLLGCLHHVSRVRVRRNKACTACGHCQSRCRVAAIRNGEVHLSQCQLCMVCVDTCPRKALEVIDAWRSDQRE